MKKRVITCGIGWVAFTWLFSRELPGKLPVWFSVDGFQHYGVFHWGVLGLCIIWLWLKRKEILAGMRASGFWLPGVIAGVIISVVSAVLPESERFLLPEMLLGWLGIFIVIFSRAAFFPSILLVIYTFSIAFPLVMNGWAGEISVKMVVALVTGIVRMFGVPISSHESIISFTGNSGELISTIIVPGCAGYATIGVFLALFALMMLDVRLYWRKAWWVFLIGLVGTWFQNLIRILVSLAAGYFWGRESLDAMHYNLAYVIFPLWYALFVWIYMGRAGWRRLPIGNGTGTPVTTDENSGNEEA